MKSVNEFCRQPEAPGSNYLTRVRTDRRGGPMRGGYSNKKIESLSLAEFHRRFVYNNRRRKLLVLLLDELAEIERRSLKMRVLVFGSFITEKKLPGDIDAMVSFVARDEFLRDVQENGVPRRHPDGVDFFTYLSVRYLFTPERILDEFNQNFKNRENHIILKDAVHIADIDGYRERIRKGFQRVGKSVP